MPKLELPQLAELRRRIPGQVTLLPVDGPPERIPQKATSRFVASLIGGFPTTTNLRDPETGRHTGAVLMSLDDHSGHAVNPIATQLYHAQCIPGTTHAIRGPAVIVCDDDFCDA